MNLPTKLVEVIDDEATGQMLRAERVAAGFSLRSIARALHFSAPYVSDLELGRRGWTEEKAAAYREALRP